MAATKASRTRRSRAVRRARAGAGGVAVRPALHRILADMGAEVIKIEKPGTGDLIRTVGLRRARPVVRLRVAQRQQAKLRGGRQEEGRPRSILRASPIASDVVPGEFRAGRRRSPGPRRRGAHAAAIHG